jgi:hypothetical protein
MAKRVVVPAGYVDEVLKTHEEGWRLITVLAVEQDSGVVGRHSVVMRELYFERRR